MTAPHGLRHEGGERDGLQLAEEGVTSFRLHGLVARAALINGAAGCVSLRDGEIYAIAAITVWNGRIATMDVFFDPARFARLDLTLLDR